MGKDVTDVGAVEGKNACSCQESKLRFLSSITLHILYIGRAIGNKNLFLETK